jgi:hypothetical protein
MFPSERGVMRVQLPGPRPIRFSYPVAATPGHDTFFNLRIFAGCPGTVNRVLSTPTMRGGEGMTLKFDVSKIRDLNGNGRLLSDVPRVQVPLVPPPVPDIDELEDVLVKHVQRGIDPTGEIQRLLRLLTHRQMRELCQKLANGKDTIASSELADAFDRFAYGE